MKTVPFPKQNPLIDGIEETITCEKCGHKIALTKLLQHKIIEEARKLYAEEAKKKISAVENEWKQKVDMARTQGHTQAKTELEGQYSVRIAHFQKQAEEAQARVRESEMRELEVLDLQNKLEDEKRSIPLQVERMKAEQREQIRISLENEIREQILLDNQDVQTRLNDERTRVESMEIEFLRKQRELEQQKALVEQQIALAVERHVADQEKTIRESAVEGLQQEFLMKLREKDEQMTQLNQKITELQRKALQGSQQLQGETQDVALQDLLSLHFPSDTLTPTPNGTRGADILQTVFLQSGRPCGKILYESKRTKEFHDNWIKKASEDRTAARADIVVIVSATLPKGSTRISMADDVFVCDLPSVIGLAITLRVYLKQLSQAKIAMTGMSQKSDRAYNYILANGHQHLKNIVETAIKAVEGVQKDKRWLDRRMGDRIQEIEEIIEHAARLYGDLQGITGNSLPQIETLQLPEPENETQENEHSVNEAEVHELTDSVESEPPQDYWEEGSNCNESEPDDFDFDDDSEDGPPF